MHIIRYHCQVFHIFNFIAVDDDDDVKDLPFIQIHFCHFIREREKKQNMENE